MKNVPAQPLVSIALLCLLASLAGCTGLFDGKMLPPARQVPAAPTLPSVEPNAAAPGATPELGDPAGKLIASSGDFAPVAWGEMPPCANAPLGVDGWRQLLAAQPDGAGAPVEQAGLLAASGDVTGFLAADPAKSQLAALSLNLASGRLNRQTGIEVSGLPEVKTVGELMDRLEAGVQGQADPQAAVTASQEVLSGKAITRPVCARLFVTRYGAPPAQVEWSDAGIEAMASPSALAAGSSPLMDTGKTAPNGKRAAFTSLSYETGGPVYLLEIETGAWTNIIEEVNARVANDQPVLPENLAWDVIGWFPDSQRLMIGPAELSSVYVIDLAQFTAQPYPIETGGLGGARLVHLAPDGSQFVYIRSDAEGKQSLRLVRLDGSQETDLLEQDPADGRLLYPRFSPSGGEIAYVVEKGHPLTGVTYAIHLYSLAQGAAKTLIEGNLGITLPAWSPDGAYIAFTRKEGDQPDIVVPEQVPAPQKGNIWVLPLATGQPVRLTAIDGKARSPAWDYDGKTLAFVTHDGQVGLVQVDQPGRIWRAAETSPDSALFTSAFFVP